jgi:hypothetical protein
MQTGTPEKREGPLEWHACSWYVEVEEKHGSRSRVRQPPSGPGLRPFREAAPTTAVIHGGLLARLRLSFCWLDDGERATTAPRPVTPRQPGYMPRLPRSCSYTNRSRFVWALILVLSTIMAERLQAVAAHSVTEPCHLAQLRKRRNAFLGLCKLPAEILGHILKLSQWANQKDSDGDDGCAWERLDYSWLCLALTCSHVWSIAVQERELWAFVECFDNKTATWTAHSITRAGHAPLRIRIVRKCVRNEANDWAAMYLPKARAALIVPDLRDRDGLQRLTDVLHKPSTLLQSFNYTQEHFVLDRSFLGGTSRTLHTLVLDKAYLTGEAMPDLPALRRLHLTAPVLNSYAPVLALIGSARRSLECISVESARAPSGGSVPDDNGENNEPAKPSLRLPHLKSLCLRDITIAAVATLLQRLPVPAQELVLVPTPKAIRELELARCQRYISWRLCKFWAPHGGGLPPDGSLTSTKKVIRRGCLISYLCEWVLEYASPGPALPRLLYRDISEPAGLSGRGGVLYGVRTLTLRRGSTRVPAVMPDLRTIVLEDAARRSFGAYYPALERWIRERVQAGTDIQSVAFVNSPELFEELAERLRKVVPHVSSEVRAAGISLTSGE